ncbi:MAG: hypothetical protein Q7T44_11965 [Parvibaculum sp.]|nr:hypothetical protein [Parvibaculum sp.]
MKDISLKAVLISSVFNFVLMVLLIIVLGAIYTAYMTSTNSAMSEAEIISSFEASWFSMLALIAPLPAGYLAASIAKRRPYLHSLLSSSLNVLWGVFCMIFLVPVTLIMLPMLVINVALSLAGGWLWIQRHKFRRSAD